MKPSDTDWLEKAFRDHREKQDGCAPSWGSSPMDRDLWLREARQKHGKFSLQRTPFIPHPWFGWWMKWASVLAVLALAFLWGGRFLLDHGGPGRQAALSRVPPQSSPSPIPSAEPLVVPEGASAAAMQLEATRTSEPAADTLVVPAMAPGPRNQINQAQMSGRFVSVTNWGRSEGLEEEPGGMARFILQGNEHGFEWRDENGDLYLGRFVATTAREDSGGSNHLSFVAHGTNRSLGRRMELDGVLWIRSNAASLSGGLPPLDHAVLEYRARWGGSNAMSWRAVAD